MSMRYRKKVCLVRILISALLLLASPVVQVHAADEMVFFHNDVMGSAIVAVNEYGDVCWEESYTPYGQKTIEEDVGIGMPPGCGLLGQERGYTSHTDDFESGLTYAQQRYYDPSMGRFLSIDPIGIDPSDPRTVNRYSYAANNPYRYTDPSGEYPSDGIESLGGSQEDQEITQGMRDGWGNLAPGYSDNDSDESRSRAANVMDLNPGIDSVVPEVMGMLFNPFSKMRLFDFARKGVAKGAQSIKQQALDLKKLNNNKNTVTVQSPGKKTHFDLDGATHKGVETPHKQFSNQNNNPKTGETFFNKDRTTVEPLTQQDIRTVRNILERRNQ